MFSVVVAVGPGPHEVERTLDLIQQIDRFEQSSIGEFLIVNDTKDMGRWNEILSRYPFVRILESVRQGQGDSWRGGMAVNILGGIDSAFRHKPISFILKVDTDSFILRSFSHEIGDAFEQDSSLGTIGSCFRNDLDGKLVPPSTWQVNLRKYLKLFRLRRNPFPHLETALWGRHRLIRTLIHQAVAHGWPLGSCAQGGGYAVSRRAFDFWTKNGFCEDPLLWLNTDLGEDVILSLLTYAAGLEIADLNQPGQPFGVIYQNLAVPPFELKRRNYAIVHSLKSKSWNEEEEVRRILSHLE